MNGQVAVQKLTAMGYRFQIEGDALRYEWHGSGKPDANEVKPLFGVIKEHKREVLSYLTALVTCRACDHSQVGDGWAMCQGEPWDGIPGQAPDLQHPCPGFQARTKPLPPPEKILSCQDCPWHRENPWTHYPELPAWCDWHFDHLAADNPACISYRRGEIQQGPKTVERTRAIRQESEIAAPTTGKKALFNRTNENIEWASWTWNPVTGCEHGCEYCYARPIANGLYKEKFNPTFWPYRLQAPRNTPLPRSLHPGDFNVFVSSMGDLFGDWVPREWIDAVLEAVRQAPEWNFLFLTKNPKRLVDIDWSPNAWVGTTVDVQSRVAPAEEAFRQIKATVKFVSCEPLLEELSFSALELFDWVITGGCRRPGQRPDEADQPDWPWVLSLDKQARKAGCLRYWKPNLKVPKEFPVKEVPREFPTTGQKYGRML